jgi:peptidase C13-like protein
MTRWMPGLKTRPTVVLFLLLMGAVPAYAQNAHVAVIVGLAGEPEHGETFRRWAGTLVDHVTGRLGVARERVVYLSDQPEQDAKRATGKSSKDAIEQALRAMAASADADDPVFIVLIGHGTFDGKVAKFNLPGPDMTPADFVPLLKKFSSRKVVFVNTASASAPFVDALSADGRTIVTATRSGAEKFATLFGGYFIDALASDSADADKNNRISVLEAFVAAKADVARAYEKQGIMITEHPLLDDGGDGEGSMDPTADGKDGRMASMVSLGMPASALALPSDPQLRQLHEERRALEQRVEALKLMKGSMEPAKYAADLEKALTELAIKTKEIRTLEGKKL